MLRGSACRDEDVWVPRCRRRHRQKLKTPLTPVKKLADSAGATQVYSPSDGARGAAAEGKQASHGRIAEHVHSPRLGKPAPVRVGSPGWMDVRRKAASRPSVLHGGRKRFLGRKQRKRNCNQLSREIRHRGHRRSVPLAAPTSAGPKPTRGSHDERAGRGRRAH